jgi:hypothetical protein
MTNEQHVIFMNNLIDEAKSMNKAIVDGNEIPIIEYSIWRYKTMTHLANTFKCYSIDREFMEIADRKANKDSLDAVLIFLDYLQSLNIALLKHEFR